MFSVTIYRTNKLQFIIMLLLWIFQHLKTWFRTNDTEYFLKSIEQLECGPMPNVMATLPNVGGALYKVP